MSIPADFPIKTEAVASGITDGIHWVAARAPIYEAVNGYVRLPDGHPWLEIDELYQIENSIPWGEITYGTGNWIGFDTLHSGQYWPGQRMPMFGDDQIMTAETVIEWTQQLAKEAAAFVGNGAYSI